MEQPAVRTKSVPPLPARRKPQWGRRILSAIADLAMPPVCVGCQTPLIDHHTLCASCWVGIDFIRQPLCDRLGLPMPYGVGDGMISAAAAANPPSYDRARSVGIYSGTLKSLVHDFKFRDRQELRSLFVRWLLEAGSPFWSDADVIVPVPLHRRRLLKRRFNQAAVLTAAVAPLTNIPCQPLLLHRTRATAQQVGLTRKQRQDNVRGAFEVPAGMASKVQQARVVLLDDVITTGATVTACATALRKAGAGEVNVLAVALTVPGRDEGVASGLALDDDVVGV